MSIGRNAPIGIFDSGVGGLTVAREISRQLPEEDFVYFGDTARVPYGSKSKDTIIKYTRQVLHFMAECEVKAVVVACNTASALALEAVKQELAIPIIGVIESGAAIAAQTTGNNRIGIIGTEATIGSGLHRQLIMDISPDIQVFGKACPLFVPLVEEGWLDDAVTDMVAARYLKPLIEQDIDTLVLGCTHYPLIYSAIARIMGTKVKLVDSAYETAVELKQLLTEQKLIRISEDEASKGHYQYYVSDAPKKFSRFAMTILPDADNAKQINIEEY